jgi:peptidoglycan/LPS O-acetylase OafA/YrhL
VLFHAGVPGNSGGFLGVDIFFVISGFLITSILLREAEEGRFSIVAFYNRRVRRIFPALFVLLPVTTIAALVLLAPNDLVAYARTLIATAVFASNAEFYRQAGYFDTSSLEKPLLHTWSLAVEEQFYLVWPLLLWTILRFGGRRWLLPIIAAGCGGSYLLAIIGARVDPAAVFFLPFTRAWELGIGAALAAQGPIGCSRHLREAIGMAGLAAIAASIFVFDESTPLFIASGVACGGTAALIACNQERTLAGQFLSFPPFVAVGLISYSLYLWHWPLLAFGHYYYAAMPPRAVRAMLLVTAVVLASLSWAFVERPLRRKGPPRRAFVASAGVISVLVAAGGAILATHGFPSRYPGVAQLEREASRPSMCDGCSVGPTGSPQIVLWGDSHAAAMSPAVVATNRPAVEFTHSACPPFVGAQPFRTDAPRMKECRRFQEHALAAIQQLHDVTLIVLAGRWSMATETTRFGDEMGGRYFLRDAETREDSVAESRRAFVAAMQRTVAALERAQPHARILIIGQPPEPGFDPAQCQVRALMFGRDAHQCGFARNGARARLTFSDALIARMAVTDPRVDAIMLDRSMCDGDRCRTTSDGTLLYRDIDHLSATGAVLLLSRNIGLLSAAEAAMLNAERLAAQVPPEGEAKATSVPGTSRRSP